MKKTLEFFSFIIEILKQKFALFLECMAVVGAGILLKPNSRNAMLCARIVTSNTTGEIKVASENVNHPNWYGGEDNPYEVIKVLKAWLTPDEMIGALKFQIIKYTPRAGKKDGQAASQDIAKAAWYADYLAKYLKEIGR